MLAGIGPTPRVSVLIAGGDPAVCVSRWRSADQLDVGRRAVRHEVGDQPARITRLDVTTGQRTMWKELMPLDNAGVQNIGPIQITRTEDSSTFQRRLSDLYLVEGLNKRSAAAD